MGKGGKPILVKDARDYVKAYVSERTNPPYNIPEKDLIVGHLFDFDLLESFVQAVADLRNQGEKIDAIRIYHAKSNRGGAMTKDESDLVIVPVMDDNSDYHMVYMRPKSLTAFYPLIIAESTPCPNICNGKSINCP